VIDIGKIEKVDAWLNAGDLLHTKKIDGEVLDVAARAFADCPYPIYSIYGNHDLVSSIAEIGSSRAFSGKIRYLDGLNGNVIRLADGTNLVGISFHSSRTKLIGNAFPLIPEDSGASILMLHQGLMGAQMAEGYIADQEDTLLPSDILNKAGLVICGHFHTPQFVDLPKAEFYKMSGQGEMSYTPFKSALIPGALEQHNWGDTGQDRGCWILDTEKHTLKFCPLTSPKFVVADETTDPKLLVGNFVKWVGKTEANLEQAATVVREVPVETKAAPSHDYKLNLSDPSDLVLSEYVKHNPQEGLSEEKLLLEGKRLLCS
jgi:DNA repair exonuclease SbcCD nuclease subunit